MTALLVVTSLMIAATVLTVLLMFAGESRPAEPRKPTREQRLRERALGILWARGFEHDQICEDDVQGVIEELQSDAKI